MWEKFPTSPMRDCYWTITYLSKIIEIGYSLPENPSPEILQSHFVLWLIYKEF